MKKIILFLFLIATFAASFGQPFCGFDKKMKDLIDANPQNAQQVLETEQWIRNYINSHPPGTSNATTVAYTVPVVIHVMHTGDVVGSIYNPTDMVLTNFITYLNQVYAGTYPGMEIPVGGSSVVNMELSFALAQRTTSCGSTNGIDRVDASSLPNYTAFGVNFSNSNGCPDVTMKNFARWNPADYYNIWVVNKIDGANGTAGQFIAGYAYFAGAPANLDGTVMLATQAVSGQSTLPHEIGHAFNLYHTFEGSNLNTSCQANGNCLTDGDRVCDTDPITNNVNGSNVYDFSCRTGQNTCLLPAVVNYNRNTEDNFMAYSNCPRLFTDGQKLRTQAAMSLPSRASLGTSLGATPCGTVINFAVASDAKAENNAGTVSGCRRYTDYTYQMNIGGAPSATATATLTYTGTAVKAVDYDVTTNGNFASPSNVLTFLSGSTAVQSFTVRVYDDAAVEAAETAILNFTVNNGGGNASIGITAPTCTITINDNDAAAVAPSAATQTVGTLTFSLIQAGNDPLFNIKLQSKRVQMLYKASELVAAGVTAGSITSLAFYIGTKSSTLPFQNLTIKMGGISPLVLANLVNGGFNEVTGLTTVKNPHTYTTGAGYNTFTFDAPYNWNGTDNLIVEVCYDNVAPSPGQTSDATVGYADGSSASIGNMFWQDGINCSGTFNSVNYFGSGVKPTIRLTVAVTGNSISSLVNSTKTAYLGPNDDVYFYDASGSIMARIKNLTAFDYGCTQVIIDRAGSTAAQFWNATTANYLTSKSFKVIPTNNTTTGSYQVTLYYTAAEVSGFNTAASPSTFATSQIVKVSNGFYIPDVTPAVPHFADSYVAPGTNAAFGSLGNTLTATFSNTGFSGFAVGTPGNSLLTANYQSKATGNYTDVTKWQYNIFGTNYIDANQVPTPASNVTILAPHAITLDASQTINTGKTFTVNGTLTAGTNTISGTGGFTLAAGGTFASSNTGTNGISQNITVSGTKTFTDGANYVFNGATTAPFGTLFTTVRPNNIVTGANITLDKPTFITGTLGFSGSNRTLTTGNNLTLVSSATGTARVDNNTTDFFTAGAITGNSISGSAAVERYIPNPQRAWHLLSAKAVTGSQNIYDSWQNAGVLAANKGTLITSNNYTVSNGFDVPSISASVLSHIQNNGSNVAAWDYSLAVTNGLTPAAVLSSRQGYMLFVRGDRTCTPANATVTPTVLKADGLVTQGPVNVSVSATGTGRTLVGNPYASAIDMEPIFAPGGVNAPNLDQNMMVWDPALTGNFGVGGFRAIVRTGINTYNHTPVVLGTPTTSDPSVRFIHSGSAFFLKATGANASVTFNENVKTASTTTVYNPLLPTAGDQQLIANLMIVQQNDSASLADGIRIRYDAAYSASINDDVEKMGNFAENISSYRNGKKLIVEMRPMIAENDTIFLQMTNTGIKKYRLQIGTIDFVQTNVTALLEDTYLKTNRELATDGSVNYADFNVTADAASAAADRFRIVFKKAGINPLPSPVKGISVYPNPVTNRTVNVRLADMPQGLYSLRLINSTGQVVLARQVKHTAGSQLISIALGQVAAGNYIVDILLPDNSRQQKAMVIVE